MSNNLVEYHDTKSGTTFYVSAFVGKDWNASIQFTMSGGENYVCMSDEQVKKLIKILQNRLKRKKGFCATDWTDPWDGEIKEKKRR